MSLPTTVGVIAGIVLLAAAGYNLFTAHRNGELLFLSGEYGAKVSLARHPPLLFWISVCFWIAAGVVGVTILWRLSGGPLPWLK